MISKESSKLWLASRYVLARIATRHQSCVCVAQFVKAATNKRRGADSDDEDGDSDDETNGLEVLLLCTGCSSCCRNQVTFVPDDTIHWSRMEQVSNRTVKAQIEDSE